MTTTEYIQRQQQRFQYRLADIRSRMLHSAAEKAAVAKKQWEQFLAKLAKWRSECEAVTCHCCGHRKVLRPEAMTLYGHQVKWHESCACDAPANYGFLVTQLRRLAGLSNTYRPAVRDEWSGWNSGKSGPRASGPGTWDNSIKAIEDGW